MDHGWHIGAGLEQAMHKNFLIVKGMTLMGEGGLKFKRFAFKNTTQVEPLPRGMSNLLGTSYQVTMLFVDVAPKLKFMKETRSLPGDCH